MVAGSEVREEMAENLRTSSTSVRLRKSVTGLFLAAFSPLFSYSAFGAGFVHTVIVDDRAVLEPTNQVTIKRGSDILTTGPGAELLSGDILRTADNAQAIIIQRDGAVEIFVRENSEIKISSIFVRFGELYVRVKQKLREKFEVESEYGVAGVEGTEFAIWVDPEAEDRPSYACVAFEGQVAVRSPRGAWEPQTLSAGVELTSRSGATPEVLALPNEQRMILYDQYKPLREIFSEQSTDIWVPSVTGLSEIEARQLLKDERLLPGEIQLVIADELSGNVVEQLPPAGNSAAPYSKITLSVGVEAVKVPSLVDMQRQEAITLLEEAGLKVGTVTEESTGDKSPMTVLAQYPEPGNDAPKGSEVHLVIEANGVRPMPPTLLDNQ